jgi:hypothetical protein
MTVLDILRERLLGRKILVHEFDFILDKKNPPSKRYSVNRSHRGLDPNDKRLKYIGESYRTVVLIDSDFYGNDEYQINVYIDGGSPETKECVVSDFTIISEIVIKDENYIGLILDEKNDYYTIGYRQTSDLTSIKEWKEEMLECSDVTDCKILKVEEIK